VQNTEFKLTVTTAPGLEELLQEELTHLGIKTTGSSFGGVEVLGSWKKAAKILLHCRLGSRVLLRIASFSAGNEAMLYSQIRRVDWLKWLSLNHSFSVRAVGDFTRSTMARTFAPLKIKDAICDEFRKKTGDRPSVNREDPDVPIVAFFRKGKCDLSLELSGQPMHRRGYRLANSVAPIKEHRAAALVRFLGYDGSRPFVDPFCGSGTLAIEAAMIATGRPSGLLRDPNQIAVARFSEEGKSAVLQAWEKAGSANYPKPSHSIQGFDIDPENITMAKGNAERAKLNEYIEFNVADARDLEAVNSDIASNPPYGDRLGDPDDAIELLTAFTHQVKSECHGSRMALVLPHGPLTKSVGLKADQRLPVMSAPLELRFMKFSIFPKKNPTNSD
jgi:putative N6-adenine-specific DNA methylase